jgi:hypothetical protein
MTFRQGGVDSPWKLLQKANSNHPQPPKMVVSKAARSQRVRRAAESVKKTIAPVGIPKRKAKPPDPKPKNDPPILICDDAQPPNSSEMGDIFEIYDHEVSLVDEAQQIMEWCNVEEQSDTDGEESEEVVKFLWPISFSNICETQKRKLKSGNSGYQLPVPNSSSDSKKLIPCNLPRTTKHNYRVNNIKALGKNNNIMSAFLKKGSEQAEEDGGDNTGTLESSATDIVQDHISERSQAYQNRIASSVDNYLAIGSSKPVYDEVKSFERKFKELNNIIAILKVDYRKREKLNKKKKMPGLELDELQEFNNLRHENRMNGVPQPAISASITTAASSNR